MKKVLVLITVFLMFAVVVGCAKKKDTCDSAKCKQIMKKVWKLDPEAVRTYTMKKAGKMSGIKNLKDIKLKKDVKKFADFLQSKSIYFNYGSGKYSHRLVCRVTRGKGLLKSKRTGYWKLTDNDTKLKIKLYGGKKIENITYKIVEMSEKKLVLMDENIKVKVPEIYSAK